MKPAQQPHKVSREIGVRSKLIQGGLNSEAQHLSGPTVPTAFLFGYPDGSTQTYSYDKGRLAKVTLPNQSEISYGNYSWMVPGQIVTPGATKTLAYDALQRPTSIEVKSQATANQTAQILMNRLYQYDQAGNIVQIKSDLGTTDYGYDKLSRLISAQPDQTLQTLGLPHEQYDYDAVHNRTSSGHQPGTWSYNGDNQLTQYPRTTPFSQAAPIDTTVSYTPQGHTAYFGPT